MIPITVNLQNLSNSPNAENEEPRLVLTVPPETRFRYRYGTEMTGTHGSLQGIKSNKEKSVPTVQLINYSQEALIRITLVTGQGNEEPFPHPHSLFVKEKLYQKGIYENRDGKRPNETGHYSGPHYIRVGKRPNNYTARFEGMCIISSKKKNFHSLIKDKIKKLKGKKNEGLLKADDEMPSYKIEKAVSCVDVDFVRLCFEALREEEDELHAICPPIYSEPIGNAKSAKSGKLKISRINKCSGSCKGGDEIWMLVEKINKKGLVIKFWEECNGTIVWQSTREGDELILHHQYAVIFKTPPYKDTDIISEAEVLLRLERKTKPNQPCDYSESITFVYEPLVKKPNKEDYLCRKESLLTSFEQMEQIQMKRARTDYLSSSMCSNERDFNSDDSEIVNMNFEDSTDNFIEQILFDENDSIKFDQAWAKFNVDEFLQFLSSEDIDMPLQKDGISLSGKQFRDFLYKIYVLYLQINEDKIKKLTDDVGNFKVSKNLSMLNEKEIKKEKDQVKDAASTLLSLRSKGLNGHKKEELFCETVFQEKLFDLDSKNLKMDKSFSKPS